MLRLLRIAVGSTAVGLGVDDCGWVCTEQAHLNPANNTLSACAKLVKRFLDRLNQSPQCVEMTEEVSG